MNKQCRIVTINNEYFDTVFYDADMTNAEVRRALIDNSNYPHNIEVTSWETYTKEPFSWIKDHFINKGGVTV